MERVIFLEPKGTVLEVIRVAKERGYHVTAIISDPDLLEHLPEPYSSAKAAIDETVLVDGWLDHDQILSIVEDLNRRHKVAGIYFGVDPCAIIGTKLRTRFSLPTPQAEATVLILDKQRLRKKLRELGLSKLDSFPSSEVEQWTTWEIGCPAYFKPIHGMYSLFVRRCENLEDLQAAISKWKEGAGSGLKMISDYVNSGGGWYLEKAFDGELMSVEGISHGGEYTCLGITSRILFSKDPTVEMGSCFPYPHPLSEKIINQLRRVLVGVGFTDGPSHTEIIVSNKGDIEIIDLNPRFIGADVLQSINHAYGIRVEELLLDWALGKKPVFSPKESNFSCIQYVLPPEPLVFESITFPTNPEVKFQAGFLKPGTRINETLRQIDYLGCYLTVQPSFKGAIERSNQLRSEVRINDNLRGSF